MNIVDELKKLGRLPYEMSESEYLRNYASIYNVIGLQDRCNPDEIRFALSDAINMFRLIQAQREASNKTEPPLIVEAGTVVNIENFSF